MGYEKKPSSFAIDIPSNEFVITSSRSGGPGGQHVNKANTKITVRWNVLHTESLTDAQKERVAQKLNNRITQDGEIIVHSSVSRSQDHNKKMAILELQRLIANALHVPKKRKKTGVSIAMREARLQHKAHRSKVKKLRTSKDYE